MNMLLSSQLYRLPMYQGESLPPAPEQASLCNAPGSSTVFLLCPDAVPLPKAARKTAYPIRRPSVMAVSRLLCIQSGRIPVRLPRTRGGNSSCISRRRADRAASPLRTSWRPVPGSVARTARGPLFPVPRLLRRRAGRTFRSPRDRQCPRNLIAPAGAATRWRSSSRPPGNCRIKFDKRNHARADEHAAAIVVNERMRVPRYFISSDPGSVRPDVDGVAVGDRAPAASLASGVPMPLAPARAPPPNAKGR